MTKLITSLCQITDALSARVACAAANLLVDEDAADFVRMDALHFAEQLGMQAARSGEPMPKVFGDLHWLEDGWNFGLNFQIELDEMSACPCCQDPDLALCPVHG